VKKKDDRKDQGLQFLGICRRKKVTGFASLATISIFNTEKNATGVKKKKKLENHPKSIRRTGSAKNAITITLPDGLIAISVKVNGRLRKLSEFFKYYLDYLHLFNFLPKFSFEIKSIN